MRKRGFTLVEIIVVMGVMVTLLSLVTINNLRPQKTSALISGSDLLISDIKGQQALAMLGKDAGIILGSANYTLTENGNNFTVNLGNNLQLTNTLSGSKIVFASGSGEVSNFQNGADTIILQFSSGENRKIQINKYGTVIYAK